MKTVPERIAALRAAMKEAGVDGFLIPSSDPHMSEYLPDCYQARSWFSGFNGSVGTLAVTATDAALWVDGRYFIPVSYTHLVIDVARHNAARLNRLIDMMLKSSLSMRSPAV